MIYRFSPYDLRKRIGDVYNGHCSIVPKDDDWIQIMDRDAMILCHESYQVIEDAINRYPDTDIFGAMTNRVGVSYQRLLKSYDTDPNILTHIILARTQAKLHGSECFDAVSVAGFFLLFRKRYWKEHPFQKYIADPLFFDRQFCKGAKTIRVIKGLYIFHSYRLEKEDFKNYDHLKHNINGTEQTNSNY